MPGSENSTVRLWRTKDENVEFLLPGMPGSENSTVRLWRTKDTTG